MSSQTVDEQLVKYLADAHSIEEQALQQLRGAPEAAGDPELAAIFRDHLPETESHERAIRRRLEAYGEGSSILKDLLMRVGGAGFLLFARAQPDTPGKLVAHAYSYEHLELAAYELRTELPNEAATARRSKKRSGSATRRGKWPTASPPRSTAPWRPRCASSIPTISQSSSASTSPTHTRSRSRRSNYSSGRPTPPTLPNSRTSSPSISARHASTSASSPSASRRAAATPPRSRTWRCAPVDSAGRRSSRATPTRRGSSWPSPTHSSTSRSLL